MCNERKPLNKTRASSTEPYFSFLPTTKTNKMSSVIPFIKYIRKHRVSIREEGKRFKAAHIYVVEFSLSFDVFLFATNLIEQ